MQIPKTRFLLLAFMLILQANGLNTGSNLNSKSQELLLKLHTTLPDSVTDSKLSPNPHQGVKVTTFGKTMAQVNKPVEQ